MRFFVRGFKLLGADRSLHAFIWKPILLSGLVYLVLMVLGWFLVVNQLAKLLESVQVPNALGTVLGSIIYLVIWWFASSIIFMGLCGTFSAYLWDELSQRVERTVNPNPRQHEWPLPRILVDGFMRFCLMIFMGMIGFFGGFVCGPLASIAVTSFLGLLDFTAPAMSRRGRLLTTQVGPAFRCKTSLSFALCCGFIALVPIVNVLLLPAMVAGGTLMVAESEP